MPSDPIAGPGSDDLSDRVLAGRYRLTRSIASGGMATVWEASDQLLDRRVAVKILHPHLASNPAFVQRFRGEAVAAARLAHPSIVSIYDTVADDGLDAIVMELVSGTTLRADIDEHGPLKLHAVLAIGSQVADALGAAHAAGLVHRDVKPANILLSGDGRVLVADFGIAKAAQGSDLTEAGSMVGTAKYLAPEQVEGGPIDGRTDLYALGVVLYEALTGRPPFVADSDASTAFARLHRDPEPPRRHRPDVPFAVEQVVLQALARAPGDRFANATAMRRALLAAGADPARAPAAAQAAAAAATDAPRRAVAPPPPAPPTPAPRSATPPPAPPARPASRPRQPSPAPAATTPPPRRSRGAVWFLLAILVVGGIAAAYAVFGAGLVGGSGATGPELPIASAASFDPQGDNGGENPDLVPNLTDGSDTTIWRTERYGSPNFPSGDRNKAGVGFSLVLAEGAEVGRVDLVTPAGGWDAEIYVVDALGPDGSVPADLAGWGEPVGTVTDAPTGAVDVSVRPTSGQAVLVWFTQAVPSPRADEAGKYTVEIADVTVRGT